MFTNIYPQIVPQDIFDIVREKVNANKFGKRSEHITYLLKDKIKCGYCGKSIIGDNGTAKNGEREVLLHLLQVAKRKLPIATNKQFAKTYSKR